MSDVQIICNRTETENVAAAMVVVFLSFVGLIGNGLVMLSFFICCTIKKQPSNYFIINLALTDIMSAVYIQMPCIVNLANPAFHFIEAACVVHSVVMWSIMTSTNWTLAAISIDRAIAVSRPFQYRNIVTTFRVRLVVAFIWILSVVLSACLIDLKSVSYNNWELMCSPKWTRKNIINSCIAALFCFTLPTVVTLLSNFSVIYAVRRLKRVVFNSNAEPPEESNDKTGVSDQTKTVRSLYVLVIVYVFLSCPYFIAKFSNVLQRDGLFPPSMVVFSMLLMFASSALNPFIYSLLRKDHRKSLFKTLKVIREKTEQASASFNLKMSKIGSICRKES